MIKGSEKVDDVGLRVAIVALSVSYCTFLSCMTEGDDVRLRSGLSES
jgi:hypothetical protein